jgi:hypothetical protein
MLKITNMMMQNGEVMVDNYQQLKFIQEKIMDTNGS